SDFARNLQQSSLTSAILKITGDFAPFRPPATLFLKIQSAILPTCLEAFRSDIKVVQRNCSLCVTPIKQCTVFIEIGDMMTQASYTTVSRALTSFSIVVLFAAACLPASAYANQKKKGATSPQQTSQDEQAEPMEVPGVFKSGIPTTGETT